MYRILVVLGLIVCLSQQAQAQNKIAPGYSTSKIDSLSKLFDAAKDDAAKINIVLNAPKRIDEYYDRPTTILNLYQKALAIAQRIEDKKSIAVLLTKIADLQMNVIVDEPQAFKIYSQALSYAEDIKDYELCGSICYHLGVITEHQNFKIEMFNYLFKSVAYTEKSSAINLTPYQGLQIMFLEENRINEALVISKKCIEYINQRKSNGKHKLLAYGLMLEVLNRMPNKKQEADQYSKKVTRLLAEINRNKTRNLSGRDIALVCYEAKQYNSAIYYASLPLAELDTNKKSNTEAMLCYEIISKAYERLGQYQKSLENYKKYSKLYIKEDENTITLESGRRVIRAEGERNLILKQKEIETERFYRNLSVAIAAFTLILGGVILFFYRREQQQKRELSQLNATKDKLVAILSHDLYSPISNLQNNVALTDWGGLSQAEFNREASQLGNQLAHVRKLLDNTLTWILSQMNGLLPAPRPLNIHELVQDQIVAQQVTATTKQITLTNQIPETIRLQADENHLIVIIRNLLQNALKFTPPGGSVVITYAQDRNQQQIQVRDTGLGMPPERLATLFTLGQNNSGRGTANERGTGLGLVLVRELMEANGGSVRAESQPGQGSVFTLAFGVS